ncbi:hypothetical protein JHK87_055198 [Glycine soja]|nr:hypothetical protein JHK87_055198 [Glycine soja]
MSWKENLISELHTKKGTWKIAMRITDTWDVKKHNGRQAIDMVLMDQTIIGAKIGSTLWQELFPEFQSKLHCGYSYLIQNIKVVDNQSEYRASPIPFLVYFIKTTSVKEVERPEIPPNVHVITEFADIIAGVALRHTLVDAVGVVTEVIERKTVNPAYRVTVKLRDNSDAKIIMSGGDEIKVFPPCVDELLGKTWAVRFKYHFHMRQSSVLDVSEEEHHIHTLTSTLGLQVIIN